MTSYKMCSCRTMAILFAIFVICSAITFTDAKRDNNLQWELRKMRIRSARRGCSSFGHSCFGGHGKRSNGEAVLPDQQQPATADVQDVNNLIPLRGATGYNMDNSEVDDFSRELLRQKLNPIIRHWLIAYRRSLENGDLSNNNNNNYSYNN